MQAQDVSVSRVVPSAELMLHSSIFTRVATSTGACARRRCHACKYQRMLRQLHGRNHTQNLRYISAAVIPMMFIRRYTCAVLIPTAIICRCNSTAVIPQL